MRARAQLTQGPCVASHADAQCFLPTHVPTVDFGEPLHSLILCGELHEFEQEMLELFSIERDAKRKAALEAAKEAAGSGTTAVAQG